MVCRVRSVLCSVVCLLVVFTLTSCGLGPEELVLEIRLTNVDDGDRVAPRSRLEYEVTTSGYQDVTVEVVIESDTTRREKIGSSLKGSWSIRGDFLERAGKSRIYLRATGTPPPSRDHNEPQAQPVVVESEAVFVEVNPKLQAITLLSPASGGTIDLGQEVKFRLTGTDLWNSIRVYAMEDDGSTLPTKEMDWFSVSGGKKDLSALETWIVAGQVKKSLGKHKLRLMAKYGDQQVLSDPFEIDVTYVLDDIELLVRSPQGQLQKAGTSELELPKVDELVIRIKGQGLNGKTLEVSESGGKLPDVVAAGDTVDIVYKPKWEEFTTGKQKRSYHFTVAIGVFQLQTGATLLRWGITFCSWRRADGTNLGNNDDVAHGSDVFMAVDTWGFKSASAKFVIMEDDDVSADDKIETMMVPVSTDNLLITWKAKYTDDSTWVPIVGKVKTDPEYFFSVQIEDVSCKSKLIEVPEP
jgi:hypothetical protein